MVTAVAACLVSLGVNAVEFTDQQARQFFNDKGCNGCHAVEETRLAPTFRLIAGRYAGGNREVIDQLAQKIRFGGAGNWGIVPMVSNPRVTPDEAHAIAVWILNLRGPAAGK